MMILKKFKIDLEELEPNKEYLIREHNIGRGQFIVIVIDYDVEQMLFKKGKIVDYWEEND